MKLLIWIITLGIAFTYITPLYFGFVHIHFFRNTFLIVIILALLLIYLVIHASKKAEKLIIITVGIALIIFTLFSGYVSGLTDLSFIKECSEGRIFKSSTTWTSYVQSQNTIFGKKVFKEELPTECQ